MRYYFFDTLDSTNEEAKRIAKSGEFEDSVIVAETQTHGRGRLGRVWESSLLGGLYYTLLLKSINFDLVDIHQLSEFVAKIVRNMLFQQYRIQTQLKFPNDILLDHKKLGGILIETSAHSSDQKPHYVIIGIGLNINQTRFPEELAKTAISLYQKTGQIYDQHKFIICLTKYLTDSLITQSH